MRIILTTILFSQIAFAQLSNDTINVNVLGGALTLSGTSAVTQSGAWTTGRTWALLSSTDSTSAIITSMPSLPTGSNIIGSIANTSFEISGSLPPGTNALGSITNTSFGISGTLPAFATTPTFNLGTLNGAALNSTQTDGTQKTQIVNASNQTIGSLSDGNGGQALEVAIAATNFIISTLNSTTTQLAASATFTGTIESVINQQSASIIMTSDKAGTLVFTEYIDAAGTRTSRTTTTAITANVPYSRSFVLNGNYFRVVFTNSAGAATTTLNINTAYGTIPSSTALGNGQVSLDEVNGLPFSTTTKAVQATNFLPTQNTFDSGRSSRTINLDSFAVTATTEVLNTMSYSTDNGTVTTGTSYTVTAAKRLRIQSITGMIHTIAGNTTSIMCLVRIRINNAGAALVTSPVQFVMALSGTAVPNGASGPVSISIPNGYEVIAGAGIGVTTTCPGFVATTAAPKVDLSITGFEY